MIYFVVGASMTTKIHAVYRNGVFLPSVPLPVAEGTEVELTVISEGTSSSTADALDEIARLPMEGPLDGFSGAEHDRVLYGEREKR
jgi:predicted DNA-binding antitoxin AbrB/MazE fold protein